MRRLTDVDTADADLGARMKLGAALADDDISGNDDLAAILFHTQPPSGARCPKCSGKLIPQEGCLNCLDCGYSKCE